jgi:transcription elongation GreA/GreB family factor
MDKHLLTQQLVAKLKQIYEQALRADDDARLDAKSGASRAVNLASATGKRLEAARSAWALVADFKAVPLRKGDKIGLGALVELEDGQGGKTVFVAPAGAGEELTGPGGDGFLHVVTPGSPIGKGLLGKRVGDVVEVMVKGELTEWEIVYAA